MSSPASKKNEKPFSRGRRCIAALTAMRMRVTATLSNDNFVERLCVLATPHAQHRSAHLSVLRVAAALIRLASREPPSPEGEGQRNFLSPVHLEFGEGFACLLGLAVFRADQHV